MKLLKKIAAGLLTLLLLGLCIILILLKYPTPLPPFPSSPLPFPSSPPKRPHLEKLPPLSIEVVETGYSDGLEAFVHQGGSLFKNRRLVHDVFLIHHPKGIVAIEGGLGTKIHEEIGQAPWHMRFFPLDVGTPLGRQRRMRESRNKILFFLISHFHWDHVSGLRDFPQIPIKVLPAEKDFALKASHPYRRGIFPTIVGSLESRMEAIELQNIPYENFPQSLDLFGDGSIVVVSLKGHTPGSMGIFVNLSPSQRYLFIGDAAWGVDEKGKPEARSFLAELFSDQDRQAARITRKRLEELLDRSNEIRLIPTHDLHAIEKLKKETEKRGIGD